MPDGSGPADPRKRETLKKLAAFGVVGLAGGLGAAGISGCSGPRAPADAELKAEVADANVIVCILDAARADHLGCYGYPRDTTPNIDRLAQQSTVFEQHFCQVSYTKASTASLFTSQYYETHMVTFKRDLPKSKFTMARGFEDAGIRTVLFTSNHFAGPKTGACHSFRETFTPREASKAKREGERRRGPEPLLRLVEGWLGENGDSRFFAYIHFLPPHRPYEQPGEMTEMFSGQPSPGYHEGKYHPRAYDFPIIRRPNEDNPALTPPDMPVRDWINHYDANLRYGDWAVGELERVLREAGLLEKTILIITSDHGEAFGEHGFVLHTPAIHDELGRIPLLVRFPGGTRAGRTASLTQSVDLLPTIFDLLEIPYESRTIQGRSLLPLLAGETDRVNDYAFTRALFDWEKYMVRGERYALLLYGNGLWRALYDLESDPEQKYNVISQNPKVARERLEVFRAFAETQYRPMMNFLDPNIPATPFPKAVQDDLESDVKKELRDLGYLK